MTTTNLTTGALAITASLAFVAALTTVIGLYFWPKSEKKLTAKDIVLALLFAFLEPFSFYGNSDLTIFSIHALAAFLVYTVTRRGLIKICHLDVPKDQMLHS